jgi:hypothetical protein
MENTTLFLLKFWGWYITLMITLLILRPNVRDKVLKWTDNEDFLFMGGIIAFMIGLASVLLHNQWDSPNEVIVSFLGWIALLKGITNLYFPNISSSLLKPMHKKTISLYLVITLGIGVYLLMKAYLGI